jgi:hypothetical protein
MPKKPAKDRSTSVLYIRLTPAELAALRKLAPHFVPLAQWSRAVLLERVKAAAAVRAAGRRKGGKS